MQHVIHRVRFVGVALITVFLLEMIPASRLQAAGGARVDNIRVDKSASQMTILYDLLGEKGEKYSITVSLRRENVTGFKYLPKNLSGDVGDEVLAGLDKKVIWDFRGDLPQGLTGDDFFVVVDVATVSTGLSPFVWIGGGVAAVAVTALLVLGKNSSEEVPPVATPTFPAEPGRPR